MNQMPPRPWPLRRAVLVGSGTLALAVATLVTGLALWLALLNPTAHRDEIAAWLSNGLGRQVTVHGGVHLAVYPWLGLHLGSLAVADADGVSPFANARAAVVQVRLWPLIRQGEVELDRIVLLEPVLYLRRDAQGRCNWDDLLALAGAAPDSDSPGASPAYAGLDMRWSGVSIVNGLLVFDDALQDQRLTLSGIHCITGEGTAFDLALQCEADSTRFGRGFLDLQGHCQVDVTSGNVILDNATLAFQGRLLPGGRFGSAAVPVALRTGLAWQTDVSMLELLDAHLDLAGEQVTASVRFEGLGAPGLRVAGRLARSAVPGGSSSLFWETVDASVAFEWSPEGLALHDLVLKSRHSALTGNVTLTLGNAPVLAMQLDAPRVSVDELA
ncbi:MAG: AsmA family protein, partial [Desulfovibrio sp.]|nr:AsmA family protein [Desulfovibrio sp.]